MISGGCRRGTAMVTTGRRRNAIGGARRVAASVVGGLRARFWSYKTARTPRSKSISSTRCKQGTCDNLINSLMLLTNQQKDGDRPVENIVTGSLEKSCRRIMDGLRKLIDVADD